MLTVTAPGKLLLLGDHAVVYGYPCLVTAVDERLSVSIEKIETETIEVSSPDSPDTRFVDACVAKVCTTLGVPQKGMQISTKSSFSGVYGFGSSSAVTVATIQALYAFFGKIVSKKELFSAAWDVVQSVQTVGSGFDVAAATFGGTIVYVKGGKRIEEVSFLDESVCLVVGYSGQKANTVALVKEIAQKREKQKEKVDKIFAAIGGLVTEAEKAMREKDWEKLGKYMNFNQNYLENLGVSTAKLETLVSESVKAGAYGAKLSGAGGGDCMIALCPIAAKQAVSNAIAKAGGEVLHVSCNAMGSRIETTDNQKELFIVVDSDDTIIGYKTRFECHHDPSLIHRTVGVLLFDDQGRVLLQRRSMTKDTDPGKWGISAAGHVTKGQSDEEAIKREMLEELGIDTPVTYIGKHFYQDSSETERGAVFKAIYNGPFSPNIQEVAEVAFFPVSLIQKQLTDNTLQLTNGAVQTLRFVGLL